MLKETVLILECSRIFSLPMTILSWLIVFVFAYVNSGNALYGFIAFIGLCFAHLGANLIDDYFDYKSLIKMVDFDKSEYLKNSQKTKCRYLISGIMTTSQLLTYAGVYFLLALICGLFLYIKCGQGVLLFASIGAVIILLYPFISRICLAELGVALAFGPALFMGVYYVMTGTYSKEAFLLSLPAMFMTLVLLYVHMVMDYEYDTNEGKRTIANSFDSQLDSLVILKYLLALAYLALIFLCVFDVLDWQIFLVCLTIPMAIDLYKSLVSYTTEPSSVPNKKWYHFPMEGMERFAKLGEDGFMFRMLQARNLMIYFSLLYVLAIILSLAC